MAKTVLVSGGAGYVGSHCCKVFAEAGWRVVVFDNLSRGWRDLVRYGDLIEGDLLDRDALDRAMADVKPDAVAHFAALSYVGESVGQPGIYYRNNTMGTMTLLDAMVAAGVGQMIFSSTCATYGVPDQVPMAETAPQSPINPYGWSKLFVEKMLDDYGRAHGIKSVKLRYFNAAGADFEAEIGERHEPETHLIPLALEGQLKDGFDLTVFGNDFDTRDGTCVRDYIHVMDLADAHLRALEHLQAGGDSDVFNLGTGTGTTVMEIIEAVERITQAPVRWTVGGRREGDPPALVASAEKARQVLGWVPQYSDIDTIIKTAWNWHQKEANTPRN
ncbi:MAG: UDP-glucose 4-epimerase GalE [Pseudomonadota bacterium]